MLLKASAPGSLMLLGEYAVLYGKHAVVCAVDKRVQVLLVPRTDTQIEIRSDLHDLYITNLQDLKIEEPYSYVLGALKQFQGRLKKGCEIDITSEFSDKVGFGSSAALTAATLAAIVTWLGVKVSPLDLIRQGKAVVRAVQGVGSGADIAASIYGGIVGFQAQPLSAEKFSVSLPLNAVYAGFKTPTMDAIKRVQDHFMSHPNLFRHLQNGIGQCAVDGIQVLRQQDWRKLGDIMNIQQGMMESLGVSTPLLYDMIQNLRKQPDITGAKISGSGLGDCVIGLGKVPSDYTYKSEQPEVQYIPVQIAMQGVKCDKV